MAIRVMIERIVQKDKEAALVGLITQLRSMASRQPGYISGETMMNADNHEEYLVISTWQSISDWKKWLASKEREKLQSQIDALLGGKTAYKIYYYPDRKHIALNKIQGWEGEE